MAKTLQQRFLEKVTILDDASCWEWQGSRDKEGYGVIYDNRRKNNSRAHRIACEIYGKPIPDHLMALHQCDNKSCVNPNHINAGTNRQNQIEARDRGLSIHTSYKRKQRIINMSDNDFNKWCRKFDGKTGRQLANLTTAIKWRSEIDR